jgi:membrane protease YdiL (CAAX protease family)
LQEPENQYLASPESKPQKQSVRIESGYGMRNLVLFNNRGLRAGWRLLIWVVMCFVLGFLLLSAYNRFHRHVPHAIAGDIAKLLVVSAIFGANAFMARVERRSALSYGLADRQWASRFSSGAVVGWLSLTLMLVGMRAAHHFNFGAQYMHGSALALAATLDIFSFLFEVALFEEILFRGYVLYTLAEGIGFWPASVLLSLLFAGAHVSNTGEAKAGIAAVVFFGLMLCFSVWRTGSLLWAIGFHFMWDYSESFLYGVPDSGLVSPEHLLSAKFFGPAWITGGSVGPEGSWFIFVVLAAVALLIHFAYPRRQFTNVRNIG